MLGVVTEAAVNSVSLFDPNGEHCWAWQFTSATQNTAHKESAPYNAANKTII